MNGFTNYEQALQVYNKYRDMLVENVDGAKYLFDYLDNCSDFKILPASLNHHLNGQGGLLIHSMNVTNELVNMTDSLNLQWERFESPYIVGLLHDLCKLEFYRAEKTFTRSNEEYKFVHNDDPECDFGGHGMLSLVIAQRFIRLTAEEMHCIRFHMGAYEQKDWSKFDTAIKKYPNVLYTHMADMVASKILER